VRTEVERVRAEAAHDAERAAAAAEERLRAAVLEVQEERVADRAEWEAARELDAVLDREIREVEKAVRTCDYALMRAASGVHAALGKAQREKQRMLSALNNFVLSVSGGTASQAHDALHAAAAAQRDGDGSAEAVVAQLSALRSLVVLRGSHAAVQFVAPSGAGTTACDSASGRMIGTERVANTAPSEAGPTASLLEAFLVGGTPPVPTAGDELSHRHVGGSNGRPAITKRAGSDCGSDTRSRVSADDRLSIGASDSVASTRRSAGAAGQRERDPEAEWLRKAKKRQAKEFVSIAGIEAVSIGQLTREAEETGEKNLFAWRGMRLRLMWDGKIRDKLVDEVLHSHASCPSFMRTVQHTNGGRRVNSNNDAPGVGRLCRKADLLLISTHVMWRRLRRGQSKWHASGGV